MSWTHYHSIFIKVYRVLLERYTVQVLFQILENVSMSCQRAACLYCIILAPLSPQVLLLSWVLLFLHCSFADLPLQTYLERALSFLFLYILQRYCWEFSIYILLSLLHKDSWEECLSGLSCNNNLLFLSSQLFKKIQLYLTYNTVYV